MLHLTIYVNINKYIKRFVLVKYSTRGLIGADGRVSKLFSWLYATCVSFGTAWTFTTFFVKHIKDDNFKMKGFNEFIVIKPTTMILGLTLNILTTVLVLIQFFSVRYITFQKKYLRTSKYQSNIITFNGNLFFFFLFEIIEIIYKVLTLSFNQSTITRVSHVYYQMTKIVVFGFLRPIIILTLLKRNMPEFFTDESQELLNNKNHFYFIGNAIPAPRQQRFSQYKPFSQNARWGWQKRRFIQVNQEISSDHSFRVERKPKLMPNVEI